jgi:hypothetical protein
MAAADPATAASFSRFSFSRAISLSPLRLPSSPLLPGRLRASSTIVALHKRNPKRLKYAAERQFTVLSAFNASILWFRSLLAGLLVLRAVPLSVCCPHARAKRGDAGMLRVKVEPSGEDFWKLDSVIDLIHRGGVGVIPTDTVYALTTRLVFLQKKDYSLGRFYF